MNIGSKEIMVEFAIWLSKYYLQTEIYRIWRNPNDRSVHNIDELATFYVDKIYNKTDIFSHYPPSK